VSGPAGLSTGCGIGQSGFQCCKFTDYFRYGGRGGAKIITKCHDKVDKWAKCTHRVDFMRSTPLDYDVSNCQRSFVVLFSRSLTFSSHTLTLALSCFSNLSHTLTHSHSLVFYSLTHSLAWPERGKLSVRFTCVAITVVRFGRKPKTVHPTPFTFPWLAGAKIGPFCTASKFFPADCPPLLLQILSVSAATPLQAAERHIEVLGVGFYVLG
jgi:hypothetical protein